MRSPPSDSDLWRRLPRVTEGASVGAVGPSSVRLWLRCESGSRLVLELVDPQGHVRRHPLAVRPDETSDFTSAFTYPDDVPGAEALEPLTRYRYRLLREGDEGPSVGEGEFQTFPAGAADMPDHFCFALASCHQPFGVEGQLAPDAVAMLRGTVDWVAEQRPRFMLWAGDQLYADAPSTYSLLERSHFQRVAPQGRPSLSACTVDEVRRLYQDRYRVFWAMPEHRRLMSSLPSYPILDDHEVLNNWGSHPEHSAERWDSVEEGALAAYADYQASRILPRRPEAGGDFHHEFDYGDVGFFIMDVRTNRRVESTRGVSSSDAQWESLSSWLDGHRHHSAIFLVISNPLLFLPSWLTRLIELSPRGAESEDRWSHLRFRSDRRRLLELLRAHQSRTPRQPVVLLSGDVHVGYALHLEWGEGSERGIHQFVSSPFTNGLTDFTARSAARVAPWLLRSTVTGARARARIRMIPGRVGRRLQPYTGLNIGLVDVSRRKEGTAVRFRLFGASTSGRGLQSVYDTGEL